MKTVPSDGSVTEFLAAVPDPRRRAEAQTLCTLMQQVTGEEPVLWGDSIIGFGSRRLRYASGRQLDWMEVGLSPRKSATTVYLNEGFESHGDLLGRLGPHQIGKSCLLLKRLDQVDLEVLSELIRTSIATGRG